MSAPQPPDDLGLSARGRREEGKPKIWSRKGWDRKGWDALSPTLRGVALMVLSTIGFAVMHVMIKAMATRLHPFEIAFFRNLFGLVVFLPLLATGGLAFLRTSRPGLMLLRGALNTVAMLCFFFALSITPVAQVTALSFTAPLFTAALSVALLGERFRLRRWAALACGFLGTLIILRPGLVPLELGPLLVLVAASIWGVTMIVIKLLSRTENSLTITAYMNIFLSLFTLGPALLVWTTPSGVDLLWLLAIGVIGTMAQMALAQALKETEPTAVLPFDFLKLVWTTLLAAWLFAELPDLWTYIGAAVVFGSAFYVAYRERQAAATPEPPDRSG